MGLLTDLVMIYMIKIQYSFTYMAERDSIKSLYLIIPAFVLGCMFHGSLNQKVWADTVWATSVYLEAMAMFP